MGVGLGLAVTLSCWTSWRTRLERGAKCRRGGHRVVGQAQPVHVDAEDGQGWNGRRTLSRLLQKSSALHLPGAQARRTQGEKCGSQG